MVTANLILSWVLVIEITIAFIGVLIVFIFHIKDNFDNWFLYPIERFIEKRKKERYERWLKTPEGRKEKYKHLFKDA